MHAVSGIATVRMGAPAASRVILMLHGIYGWGRNWAAIAKGLLAARPDLGCVLLDLPYHGASGPGRHGDTVRGLADDIAAWAETEGLAPDAVLGHSFGGKVALALAGRWKAHALQTWLIDSTPDAREPSGSAWELLQIVREPPATFASRDEFVIALTDRGWATGVAQWMATNLERRGDTFAWRLDFGAMERLLRDFFSTDFWPVVEQTAPGHAVHFIKASASSVMSDAAVQRAQAAGHHVHLLEGGHWIHAERPDDVVALIAKTL